MDRVGDGVSALSRARLVMIDFGRRNLLHGDLVCVVIKISNDRLGMTNVEVYLQLNTKFMNVQKYENISRIPLRIERVESIHSLLVFKREQGEFH